MTHTSTMIVNSLPVARPGADRVLEAARKALVSEGAHVMPAVATKSVLGVTEGEWQRFAKHWETLSSDRYASEHGTCRLRRYGHLALDTATRRMRLLSQDSFVQPENSNPLYVGRDRRFAPLTDSFVADPVFRAVSALLAGVATALDDPAEWDVKVHPFRVLASTTAQGLPAPEGRHRDGVTLVSSLLINRRNAAGGQSSVFDPDGNRLLATTLSEPGDLLLGDDRRTLHDVSAVRPARPNSSGVRDVLVVTFTPR
ncbi:2OG-Fe dioxygenase family protein [Nocardia suismassiliense]|uniref:2OG-Fe dioxygenase family protein n=1 Tax=Nocardia suismassiliense TaxID=2077092 RepID=UPI001F4814DB|nr:2OG-Fe dioxygenase family protein [Nocardia suismassiliense]